jgi:hypothetical protein
MIRLRSHPSNCAGSGGRRVGFGGVSRYHPETRLIPDWRTNLNAGRAALFILTTCLSTCSTWVHAQAAPSNAWEGFHLAITKADRAAAASVLAADVQIFESGFVERSRDEYLSHHFDADAKFARTVTRKVIRHSEQIAGNMALVLEETESNGSYEGRPVNLLGTETAVLRLNGEKWQIVHIHWSSRKPKP